MTDEELERLARAATPGPWVMGDVTDKHVISSAETYVAFTAVLDEWRNATVQQEADAAFIVALNPATALALLDRVRKAEEQLARIAATLEYEGPEDGMADAVKASYLKGMDLCFKALDRAKKAEAKTEHLRAVGTGLANAAYNLKQQDYIPEEHRRSLDEGQRAWDAAVRDDKP